MISRETIERIITAGCAAPSGGNSQPWKFEVEKKSRINVYALPEKDHPVLNVSYGGTWIAHGALLENITIAASAYGLEVVVTTYLEKEFSAKGRNLLASRIELVESPTVHVDARAAYIDKRATNRKPYRDQSIPKEIRNELNKLCTQGTLGASAVHFIDTKETIKKITRALSVGDRIMFENKTLHRLFFKEMVWNKKEEQKKGGGLLLDTLELKPPPRLMLHLLQYWNVMRFGRKVGIARKIASENAATMAACDVLCCFAITDSSQQSFLDVGRSIERVWLAATQQGLSAQLITGLFFFKLGCDVDADANVDTSAGGGSVFSNDQKRDIMSAYSDIVSALGGGGKGTEGSDGGKHKGNKGFPIAVLRLGYSTDPSARSMRGAPFITWLD